MGSFVQSVHTKIHLFVNLLPADQTRGSFVGLKAKDPGDSKAAFALQLLLLVGQGLSLDRHSGETDRTFKSQGEAGEVELAMEEVGWGRRGREWVSGQHKVRGGRRRDEHEAGENQRRDRFKLKGEDKCCGNFTRNQKQVWRM